MGIIIEFRINKATAALMKKDAAPVSLEGRKRREKMHNRG